MPYCFQFTKISDKHALPSWRQHVAFKCWCLSTKPHTVTLSHLHTVTVMRTSSFTSTNFIRVTFSTDQNILGTAVKVSRILFSVLTAQAFQQLLQAISIYDNFPRFKSCTHSFIKKHSRNMNTDTLHYITHLVCFLPEDKHKNGRNM